MDHQIDTTAVKIGRIEEVETDFSYWTSQPVELRLSTVEDIRREYHAWRNDPPPVDLREFAKLLSRHGIRYLVVGGYAVAFHGHPRYTKDLDIWIDRGPDNAAAMLDALQEFGFGSVGLKADDFLQPYHLIQLGRPPSRIDILTDLKGVEFAKAYIHRETEVIDDVPVYFIALEDLRQNKRAVGRHQDLADLDNLE